MLIKIPDKWILCPACGAKTRIQILDDTELKNFPLFCPKCKRSFIISSKHHMMEYRLDARR
ncbi:cysteine-rich KTR domain-containing protein [Blautia sp. HCP3S3_H10_1]|uniref:cysteine-rich KTR domain-containing protein n=1 Tax=unclassified Blautia TaxID=2648079 RepID=UPI003F90A1CC